MTDKAIHDFAIEKNIPIPAKKYNRYPLDKMEVGDSFAVPLDCYAGLTSSVRSRQRRGTKKFKISKQGDVVRCWRIE